MAFFLKLHFRRELTEFIQNALASLGEVGADQFYALSDCKSDEDEEKTELGIWRTNNFALGRSSKKCDNGIFAGISRFNHSCVPSAEFRWNSVVRKQEVRAIRDIQPDAPDCTSAPASKLALAKRIQADA